MDKQESRRYPIGKFEYGKNYTISETKRNIKVIASLPKELKKILKKISRIQLDTPYRSGGWTVRQVIHHLSDSHVNAYIRMKMAVTEKNPIIKPYDEQAWAELESGKAAPVKPSVRLLKVLHSKWIDFLESLSESDLKKGYFHPAMKRVVLLPEAIALYAWHTEHHLGHIRLVSSGKLEIPQTKAEQKFEKAAAKATAKATDKAPVKKTSQPSVATPKLVPNNDKTTTVTQPEKVAKAPTSVAQAAVSVIAPDKKADLLKSPAPKAVADKDVVLSTTPTRAEISARIKAARQTAMAEAEAELKKTAKVKTVKTTTAAPKKAVAPVLPKTSTSQKDNTEVVPVAQPKNTVKVKKENTTNDAHQRRVEGLAKARAIKQAKAADAAAQPEKPSTDQ